MEHLLIIVVMIKEPKLRNRSGSFYIVSLAIVDFNVCVAALSEYAWRVFIDNDTPDCLRWTIQILLKVSYVFFPIITIIQLTVERFLAICYFSTYLRIKNKGYRKYPVLISIAASFIAFFTNKCTSSEDPPTFYLYAIEMSAYLILLCFIMMIVAYVLIFRRIKHDVSISMRIHFNNLVFCYS